MRMLEKASPRVKVFSLGKTEEGREMIAVAVANEKLIAGLEENRARLAKRGLVIVIEEATILCALPPRRA